MKGSRLISLIYIVTGGLIALYAQADTQQNQWILIVGVVMLMLGLYRISRTIPSKTDTTEFKEDSKDEV